MVHQSMHLSQIRRQWKLNITKKRKQAGEGRLTDEVCTIGMRITND